MTRVAFVIQRYGTHVLGGAEQGCRQLAENLAELPDFEVEVLTSTAREATTWANHFEPGVSVEHGVQVRRFPTKRERDLSFYAFDQSLGASPRVVKPDEMERWVDEQGPTAPGLIHYLREHGDDYDVVIFYTYLYYFAIRGVPVLGDKALLLPTAHDETPIYYPVFKRVFESAGGLLYLSEEEREFCEGLFDVASKPNAVLGLGLYELSGDADAFHRESGIDQPFILYLGRVKEGKGVLALFEFFRAYKQRNPSDLQLVYAGPIGGEFETHPDVHFLGPVSEETKWNALSAAGVLVNPSPFESFSMVIMESWLAGRPVMVYEGCGPTRGHARRSGGGMWFERYGDFEAELDMLVKNPALADDMGRRGEAYVRSRFIWPVLREHYGEFIRDYVAARAS